MAQSPTIAFLVARLTGNATTPLTSQLNINTQGVYRQAHQQDNVWNR